MPAETEPELLRRYFIDESLTDADRDRIEEQCLASEAYFERFQVAEESVIEQYLRGELDAHETARFEVVFASPEQRRSVALSRAIAESLRGPGQPDKRGASQPVAVRLTGRRAAGPAAAAALVVSIAAIAWLAFDVALLRRDLADARRQQVRLRAQTATLETQAKAARGAAAAGPDIVDFALTTELARSRSQASPDLRHRVPAGTRTVRLRLAVPAGGRYVVFAVRVLKPADRSEEVVWSAADLTAELTAAGRFVTIDLPAAVLAGDSILAIQGAVEGGDYVPLTSYAFSLTRG